MLNTLLFRVTKTILIVISTAAHNSLKVSRYNNKIA